MIRLIIAEAFRFSLKESVRLSTIGGFFAYMLWAAAVLVPLFTLVMDLSETFTERAVAFLEIEATKRGLANEASLVRSASRPSW